MELFRWRDFCVLRSDLGAESRRVPGSRRRRWRREKDEDDPPGVGWGTDRRRARKSGPWSWVLPRNSQEGSTTCIVKTNSGGPRTPVSSTFVPVLHVRRCPRVDRFTSVVETTMSSFPPTHDSLWSQRRCLGSCGRLEWLCTPW